MFEPTGLISGLEGIWGLLSTITVSLSWVIVEVWRRDQRNKEKKNHATTGSNDPVHLRNMLEQHVINCPNTEKLSKEIVEFRKETSSNFSHMQETVTEIWKVLAHRGN